MSEFKKFVAGMFVLVFTACQFASIKTNDKDMPSNAYLDGKD